MNIQDVHIRYEDPLSIPSKCVAFGATIESLVAQSCDSSWVPGIMQSSKREESFKLLELQNFGLYWINLNENEMLSNINVSQLSVSHHMFFFHNNKFITSFQDLISLIKLKKHIKNYILPSVSAQAHLKRNCSTQPLRSSTPRIACDLMLKEVHLTLIDVSLLSRCQLTYLCIVVVVAI